MKKQSGFTLIELMIVVAIVAVLAAVAMPAYQKYTAKAKFTEVVSATGPVKQQVELCYFDKGTFVGCNNGVSGNGWNILAAASYANGTTTTGGYVASIAISGQTATAANMTVTALAKDGFVSTDTFILAATAVNGSVTWKASGGTCTAKEYC